MSLTFIDRGRAPPTETLVQDEAHLTALLNDVGARGASFVELVADKGDKLLIGVSPTMGCVQYSCTSDEPPYMMAVSSDAEGFFDFQLESSLTTIPMRYCLPMARVGEIAATFLRTGERSPQERWEEI
jgi:hypothetical protein